MSLFLNRRDAARRLARALAKYHSRNPVVFALPRGGVPVAAEVAAALEAPLDLVLVRKVGAPSQPELAMGAVVDAPAPVVVRNEEVIRELGVDAATFEAACARERVEMERRRRLYLGPRPRGEIADATAIVVDDGIATGATMKAALRALRQPGPAALVLAIPVAPAETLEALRPEVDALICLETPEPFGAIGFFYDDFRQVSDRDVIAILRRFPARRPPPAA